MRKTVFCSCKNDSGLMPALLVNVLNWAAKLTEEWEMDGQISQ